MCVQRVPVHVHMHIPTYVYLPPPYLWLVPLYLCTEATSAKLNPYKNPIFLNIFRCRAALEAKEMTIQKMRDEHETTLSAICRQLLELECGLRKKEKELTTALLQREKVIREQSYLIRVLGKKAGAKRSDIRQLCDEAKAKIPQVRLMLK